MLSVSKLLAAATISTICSGLAVAADLPVKAGPQPMVAPVASWTGCYVGAGGGYGMWNQDNKTFLDDGSFDASNMTAGGRGWFGTVQVGCDYQVAPSWVVGVFGDYDFSSIKGDLGSLNNSIIGQEKLSAKWAAGGRLGYVVVPQLLAFVSAGWTQAHFNHVDFIGTVGNPPVFMPARNYSGYFIGTGYEYGLAWLSPNLTWKTEYRFGDYGSRRNTVFNDDGSVYIFVDSKKYTQEVRSELVYRFNWR
jgi:outer membrane immunogenic protein